MASDGGGGSRAFLLAPGSILPGNPSPRWRDCGGGTREGGGTCLLLRHYNRDLTGGNNGFWSIIGGGGRSKRRISRCHVEDEAIPAPVCRGHGAALVRMAMPDALMPCTDASRNCTAISLLTSSAASIRSLNIVGRSHSSYLIVLMYT